jgi:hypothetical protein
LLALLKRKARPQRAFFVSWQRKLPLILGRGSEDEIQLQDGWLSAACRGMAMSANKKTVKVGELASARSGDKGNHANIGVVARDEASYEVLLSRLTAVRVQDYFRELGVTRVERFELPHVQALNFLLYDALAGGASRSLRIDTQGKLLGTALLDLVLVIDSDS